MTGESARFRFLFFWEELGGGMGWEHDDWIFPLKISLFSPHSTTPFALFDLFEKVYYNQKPIPYTRWQVIPLETENGLGSTANPYPITGYTLDQWYP